MGMRIRDLIGSLWKTSPSFKAMSRWPKPTLAATVPGSRGRGAAGNIIVVGMKQHGGPIRVAVVPNVKLPTLRNGPSQAAFGRLER